MNSKYMAFFIQKGPAKLASPGPVSRSWGKGIPTGSLRFLGPDLQGDDAGCACRTDSRKQEIELEIFTCQQARTGLYWSI
jgi:hypothetical protein